jgi:hypothetical protein
LAEQIIDGNGSGYFLAINPDGSINTVGSNTFESQNPYMTLVYISSGTSTGVTGSSLGSIIKFVGAGSFVKVLSYSNNNLIGVGSWY